MASALPPHAGIGLKAEHYRAVLDESLPRTLWAEVHPENYMVDGGPRLAWLEAIRARHPLSLHGVGASLGSQLDPGHVARLKALADRFEPAQISEHVAWSTWEGTYYGDLLPLPYTKEALDRLCANIDRLQTALGRTILIENPSLYVAVSGEMSETDFLSDAVRRTGCGLLLDINNVYVCAHNLGRDPYAYLDALPHDAVGEIHLAGHAEDASPGAALLIDNHGAPICQDVWDLYRRFIERAGPKPTLIERDADIPPFAELIAERDRAETMLAAVRSPEPVHV